MRQARTGLSLSSMIICSTCQHPNPEQAAQCENCFSVLPKMNNCPNCAVAVQSDASFCGQCGFKLQPASAAIAFPPPDMPALNIPPLELELAESSVPETPVSTLPRPPIPPPPSIFTVPSTPIAAIKAQFFHLQTKVIVTIPPGLAVIHLGKPNDRIPPNIDLSGFPNSEIVSRIHADLRLEGENLFLEDVGSANGTYINNQPLLPGNRHLLSDGDRIAFGKGDLVTFIYQAAS